MSKTLAPFTLKTVNRFRDQDRSISFTIVDTENDVTHHAGGVLPLTLIVCSLQSAILVHFTIYDIEGNWTLSVSVMWSV